MSGNVALLIVLSIIAGLVWEARYRPWLFGDGEDPAKRPPQPTAVTSPTVVIDTTGRSHGCSVLVNGMELNTVVKDIDIRLPVGERPSVYLDVVPLDGFRAVLEDAGVYVSFEDPPGAPGDVAQ